MSLKAILEDWSAYESYKHGLSRNPVEFSTEDPWEVDFLTKKISEAYPFLQNRDTIRQAISVCGQKISMPRQRRLLVQCVMKILDVQ